MDTTDSTCRTHRCEADLKVKDLLRPRLFPMTLYDAALLVNGTLEAFISAFRKVHHGDPDLV